MNIEHIPHLVERAKERAQYRVAVFAASSNENKYAVTNGRISGRIIGEEGFSIVNGGYPIGGMGAAGEGFDEATRNLNEAERNKRKLGVIFSRDTEHGKNTVKERGLIPGATFQEEKDFGHRSAGIIENADACIAVEGGIGTMLENGTLAMDEYFRGKDKNNFKKPLIIIDKKNSTAHAFELIEKDSPGTINTLTDNIFILSGHMVKKGDDMVDANLENDPKMQEQLKELLEYFFLKKISEAELSPEEKARKEELRKMLLPEEGEEKGELAVLRLKEYMKTGFHFVQAVDTRKQYVRGGGEGI